MIETVIDSATLTEARRNSRMLSADTIGVDRSNASADEDEDIDMSLAP